MAKDNNEKKEIMKLVGSTLVSFFASLLVSNKMGSKVSDKFGGAVVGVGVAVGSVAMSKNIGKENPMVALGLMAGSGLNAGIQILKSEPIKSRLPQYAQDVLGGGFENQQVFPIVQLSGMRDEDVMQDVRVIEMARQMAGQEIAEYQEAMNGTMEMLQGKSEDEPFAGQLEYEENLAGDLAGEQTNY